MPNKWTETPLAVKRIAITVRVTEETHTALMLLVEIDDKKNLTKVVEAAIRDAAVKHKIPITRIAPVDYFDKRNPTVQRGKRNKKRVATEQFVEAENVVGIEPELVDEK
jgi:hypothetical protein